MPKKPKKQTKISPQLFTQMVMHITGAKVHLDFAAKLEPNLKKGQLEQARAYLKDLSQIVERLRWGVGGDVARLPKTYPLGEDPNSGKRKK